MFLSIINDSLVPTVEELIFEEKKYDISLKRQSKSKNCIFRRAFFS